MFRQITFLIRNPMQTKTESIQSLIEHFIIIGCDKEQVSSCSLNIK